ncbi:hypothetical protein JCM14469_24130 [Desulfatiferula olefinivorans]
MDILSEMPNHKTPQGPARRSPFGHLFRFIGKWFGFTGLYAAFSVCPFCGQAGCPVGVGLAGSVGAFFALCATDWKQLLGFIRSRLKKTTNTR